MRPTLTPGHRWPRAAVAAGILALLGVLAWLPARSPQSTLPLPQCSFKAITGLPCALCGGTRATSALLQGDIPRVWELNALAFPSTFLLLLAAAILVWEATRGRPIANWPHLTRTHWRKSLWILPVVVLWWVPQMIGALKGSKSELIDLRNPIARTLSEKFR